MPAPTPYELTYDFTSFQEANPTTPLPADKVEIEFNNISLTTTEIIANLGMIQRDDGALANESVGVDQLDPTVRVFLGAGVGDIALLAGIIDDIELLADIEDGTIATEAITTVAGIAPQVVIVAGISGSVTTVAGISANVTAVANNVASVNTVAGIAPQVVIVADSAAAITIVAGMNPSHLSTVAGISADVTTVAGVSADVTTVAGVDEEVVIVAGISADVTTVAGVAADVTTVAGVDEEVVIVAGISADVTTVAANIGAVLAAPGAAVTAENAATAAEGFAIDASNYAAALHGTSVTSVTVGIGSKTFLTQTNRQWQVGQRLRVNNPGVTLVMTGDIVSYSGTTLEIDVDYIEGIGTDDDWIIQISGERGEQGPAGNLADANYGDVTISGLGSIFVVNSALGGTVSGTELGYLAGVTSAIQTQINGKQATGNYITDLTGDVTASGPGSASATIANGAVTNAKLEDMAAGTFKLNATGGAASPTDGDAATAWGVLGPVPPRFATPASVGTGTHVCDFADGDIHTVTATGNFTLEADIPDGQAITIRCIDFDNHTIDVSFFEWGDAGVPDFTGDDMIVIMRQGSDYCASVFIQGIGA